MTNKLGARLNILNTTIELNPDGLYTFSEFRRIGVGILECIGTKDFYEVFYITPSNAYSLRFASGDQTWKASFNTLTTANSICVYQDSGYLKIKNNTSAKETVKIIGFFVY